MSGGGYGAGGSSRDVDMGGGWGGQSSDRGMSSGGGYGAWSGGASMRDMGRQSHAGRGPRNYRRSDQRIEEDVNEALMMNPDIDALEIVVVVDDGEVTLSGDVDDRHAKRLAEDVAEQVPGVRDVHNELKARHGLLDRLLGRSESDRESSRSDRDVTPGAQREKASATSGTSSGTSTSGATSGSSTTSGSGGSGGSGGSSSRGRNASSSSSSDRS
jgi:hypothetical protein